MKSLLLSLAVSALALGAGCWKASVVHHHLLYLDSVDGPATASVGQEVVYTVRGNKPDPAWVVDAPEITRSEDVVTVDVVGHRGSRGMAVQVLMPFTTTATLSDLPAGSFVVRFRGQQRTLERHLVVAPD